MPLNILLMDESFATQKVFEVALRSFNPKVRCVDVSEDLNSILSEFHPQIAFIDVLLKQQDGFQVTKNLKNLHKALPVVVMYSSFMALDEEKFKECGANASIEKPFTIDELKSTIQSFALPQATSPPAPKDHIPLTQTGFEAKKPSDEKPSSSPQPPKETTLNLASPPLQKESSSEDGGKSDIKQQTEESLKVSSPSPITDDQSAEAFQLKSLFGEDGEGEKNIHLIHPESVEKEELEPTELSQDSRIAPLLDKEAEKSFGLKKIELEESASLEEESKWVEKKLTSEQEEGLEHSQIKEEKEEFAKEKKLETQKSKEEKAEASPLSPKNAPPAQRRPKPAPPKVSGFKPPSKPFRGPKEERPKTIKLSQTLGSSDHSQSPNLSQKQIADLSEKIVADIAWQVVPELATQIIEREIEKILTSKPPEA